MTTKYFMHVIEIGYPEDQYEEEIEKTNDFSGIEVKDNKSAILVANATIEFFNATRSKFELKRELVTVTKVTYEEIHTTL